MACHNCNCNHHDHHGHHEEPELESVQILAKSEDEATLMSMAAKATGNVVRGQTIWTGPVPERGSFTWVRSNIRMSTPEYFFLRKANTLGIIDAAILGMELCGKYRTSITSPDMPEDKYEFLTDTRTSTAVIRDYLMQIKGTPEYERAIKVLNLVSDRCASPMQAWLFLAASLPTELGGAGLPRPIPAALIKSGDSVMPGPRGHYLTYDLMWNAREAFDRHAVTLQYVGPATDDPTQCIDSTDLDALLVAGECILVDDGDVQDPYAAFASVAKALGDSCPEPARISKELQEMAPTRFRYQRMLTQDIMHHDTDL